MHISNPKSGEGFSGPAEAEDLRRRLRDLEREAEEVRASLEGRLPDDGIPDRAEDRAPGKGHQAASVTELYRQVATILDITHEAIITIDDRAIIRRFNRGAEAIFGYRASEMIGRPLDILMPERFRRPHRSHVAGFGREAGSSRSMNQRGELVGLRRDGSEFPAEASIARQESGGHVLFTAILRDISDRKAAEAAIQANEALLKSVLDNLPAATHIKDLDGRYTMVNREYERQFGVRAQEVIGRTTPQAHPAHIAEKVLQQDREVLAGKPGQEHEFELFDEANDRTILTMKRLLAGPDGKPAAILCVETDLTDRKRAEAELRAREALLRQAQVMARIGVFVWDEVEDRCQFCSDEMASMLGMTVDRFKQICTTYAAFLEHVHEADRGRHLAIVVAARQAKTRYDMEYRFLTDDGRTLTVRESGEPEFDGSGNLIRTFGTFQDVTEMRRAEETLRERDDQLRQAQNLARLGTFVWNDITDSCEYCSKEIAAILGLTAERFMAERGTGEAIARNIHPDDIERYRNVTGEATKAGKPYDVEIRYRDDAGRLLHVREIGKPGFDSNGRQVRTFGMLQDVTEARRAEQALRQNEGLLRQAQRMARIGTFIWNDAEGRCISCSEELAALFGMTAAQFIKQRGTSKKYRANIHPDDREAYAEAMADFVRRGDVLDIEYRCYHTDGSIVHIREICEPHLGESGQGDHSFGMVQDVTEARRAEQALRRNEGLLRQAQRMARIGTFIWNDAGGRCTHCSDELAALFGMTAEQFIAQRGTDETFIASVHPDDRHRFVGAMEGYAGRPGAYDIEYRCLRPDGSVIHLREICEPFYGNGQSGGHSFGMLQDITERKDAEAALRRAMRESEVLRKIAAVANEATDVEQALAVTLEEICAHGDWLAGHYFKRAPAGDVMVPGNLWYSRSPEKIEGLRRATASISFESREGLPGRVMASRAPAWISDLAADKNFFRTMLVPDLGVASGFAFPVMIGRQVMAVVEFFSETRRIPDPDLVELTTRAGTILGRAFERQAAEQSLRDSEEQLRLITDNLPVLIAYVGPDKQFRFVNKTTERWYGHPAAELISHPLSEFFPPEAFARMEPRLDAALSGEIMHFDETLTYSDGRTRNIDVTYLPHLGPGGETRGVFALVADVTDRLRAEEQLRQSQKMEAVGKLTGGVAHDFNNLLAVILGNVELLHDRVGASDPSVQAISRATMRGSELTQRLLSFSRQQPLRPESLDVSGVIREMAGMLARTLGETIRVETHLARSLWPARVDPGQLENAVLNLAINAQQAMKSGGTLRIATRNITLNEARAAAIEGGQPGDFVELSLSDTGSGMPEEVRARAFEPFFTTKGVGEGSGLGLSMVYGFATQSGGFVTLQSEPEKGTTVRLFLPRTAEGAAICSPAAVAEPETGGGTILVIEDDPDVRQLTVALLRSLGYTVLEAEDGETAMPLIKAHPAIDMLLSDVVLPGGSSGPAIAEAARKLRPELRVLFMSGYAEDVIRRNEQGDMATMEAELLPKPFSRVDLARKVRATLDRVPYAAIRPG